MVLANEALGWSMTSWSLARGFLVRLFLVILLTGSSRLWTGEVNQASRSDVIRFSAHAQLTGRYLASFYSINHPIKML